MESLKENGKQHTQLLFHRQVFTGTLDKYANFGIVGVALFTG